MSFNKLENCCCTRTCAQPLPAICGTEMYSPLLSPKNDEMSSWWFFVLFTSGGAHAAKHLPGVSLLAPFIIFLCAPFAPFEGTWHNLFVTRGCLLLGAGLIISSSLLLQVLKVYRLTWSKPC